MLLPSSGSKNKLSKKVAELHLPPTFILGFCLAYSLILKMEATRSSKMSDGFQWTTWCYILEGDLDNHHENIKSYRQGSNQTPHPLGFEFSVATRNNHIDHMSLGTCFHGLTANNLRSVMQLSIRDVLTSQSFAKTKVLLSVLRFFHLMYRHCRKATSARTTPTGSGLNNCWRCCPNFLLALLTV
jgi:hypothetical protein